jgi:hypothetical protein
MLTLIIDDESKTDKQQQQQQQQQQQHRWLDLARPVLDIVFSFLRSIDLLVSVERTCKSWYNNSNKGTCWRNIVDITYRRRNNRNIRIFEDIVFEPLIPSLSLLTSSTSSPEVKVNNPLNQHRRLTDLHRIYHLIVVMTQRESFLLSRLFSNTLVNLTIYNPYGGYASCLTHQIQYLTSLTSLTFINDDENAFICLPRIPTLRSLILEGLCYDSPTINVPFSYPLLTKLHVGIGITYQGGDITHHGLERCCQGLIDEESFNYPLLEDFKLHGEMHSEDRSKIIKFASGRLQNLDLQSFGVGHHCLEQISTQCLLLTSLILKIDIYDYDMKECTDCLKKINTLRQLEMFEGTSSCGDNANMTRCNFVALSELTQLTSLYLHFHALDNIDDADKPRHKQNLFILEQLKSSLCRYNLKTLNGLAFDPSH